MSYIRSVLDETGDGEVDMDEFRQRLRQEMRKHSELQYTDADIQRLFSVIADVRNLDAPPTVKVTTEQACAWFGRIAERARREELNKSVQITGSPQNTARTPDLKKAAQAAH